MLMQQSLSLERLKSGTVPPPCSIPGVFPESPRWLLLSERCAEANSFSERRNSTRDVRDEERFTGESADAPVKFHCLSHTSAPLMIQQSAKTTGILWMILEGAFDTSHCWEGCRDAAAAKMTDGSVNRESQ